MTSILKVDNIQNASGTGTPYITGAVLQVQYTQYSGTFQQSITADTDTVLGSAVPTLTLNITPKSTSSIIRLDAHIFHEWSDQNKATECVFFFFRDTTKLAHAQASSRRSGISISALSHHSADGTSTPETVYYSYFDAPSTTSQITYKVGVSVNANSTLNVNRTGNDTDNAQAERGISFISATEIGG